MRRLLQSLSALMLMLAVSTLAMAQVTTASMSGEVRDNEGATLPGATVVATHTPSGTVYGTVTREDGKFNYANLLTGGPYSIKVTYVGFTEQVRENIYLSLGQNVRLNFTLQAEGVSLGEVTVSGQKNEIISSDRTGASTILSQEVINQLPTISRNINDFTRLTPQSSGTSFGGRDNRFNNYSVDGNIYNNNFGLGSSQFAGGNPISLDAIEQVQVNLAPYDVRQGGFSGANVNAVTRRGTNEFSASAYGYYRNQSFIGTQIGDIELNAAEAFTRIFGLRIGGPIIKDKLFFFISAEQEDASNPGLVKEAARPGKDPDGLLVSRVPADRLDFVQQQMLSLYGYETGDYEGYSFANSGLRLNARIDYNISQDHKLMVRFNRYSSFNDQTVNGNSLRYNPSALRYGNTNRFGIEAMNFRNSHYTIDNNITSLVAELNSVLSNKMSNNFRIGYTAIEDPVRGIPGGQAFPFIEVLEFDGTTPQYYMTMGNELFSVGNLLENNIFNITNNFSYFTGKHNITAGVNFEMMGFSNAFNPVLNGLYRFNSYDNFVAAVIDRDPTVKPDLFLQGYSFEGPDDIPTDDTRFAQLGIYAQDNISVNDNLNVTLGLRVDMPFYPIDLPTNEKLNALGVTFTNPQNGETLTPDVSQLPGVQPLIQPRLGFNYDVKGDGTMQVRGGTGVFSGRIPFVWISNQVNNNGVTRGGYGLTADQWGVDGNPEWDGFQSDVTYYRPDPSNLEAVVSQNLALTDANFKLPMVWRTNLALDAELPKGFIGTVEAIYNKDINSPLAVNVNTNAPSQTINTPYPFPYWTGSSAYYTNGSFRDVILLTNTNVGHYAALTFQIRKSVANMLDFSLAYTRSVSRDFGLEGGSQAASLWPNTVVGDRNDPEIGFSRFDQPNRVVGYVSFTTEKWTKRFPTTVSLFYDGGERGRFSYIYSGRFNDGANRLMYIPATQAEANLVDLLDKDGNVVKTAAEQWTILNDFIEQDDYLSANRGTVAERNGAKLPWLNRFDLRLIQDITFTPDMKNKLQITFDVLNFGNLLNSDWGVSQTSVQRSLLNLSGVDADGNASFTLNTIPGTSNFPAESYRPVISLTETWSAQLGIRYIFN